MIFGEPKTPAAPESISKTGGSATPDPRTLSQAVALYRYLPPLLMDNELEPPQHLDYRVAVNSRLFTRKRVMYGELVSLEFFGRYEPESDTFEDLVVGEAHTYVRNAENYAIKRDIVISWYKNDGGPHPDTKIRTKFYDAQGQINELKRRRENIIDWLRGALVGTPLEPLVRDLLERLTFPVTDYIQTGSNMLRQQVVDAPEGWLDELLPQDPRFTFRQYLPSEIAKGMRTSDVS